MGRTLVLVKVQFGDMNTLFMHISKKIDAMLLKKSYQKLTIAHRILEKQGRHINKKLKKSFVCLNLPH
jgi:transcriptional regulator